MRTDDLIEKVAEIRGRPKVRLTTVAARVVAVRFHGSTLVLRPGTCKLIAIHLRLERQKRSARPADREFDSHAVLPELFAVDIRRLERHAASILGRIEPDNARINSRPVNIPATSRGWRA